MKNIYVYLLLLLCSLAFAMEGMDSMESSEHAAHESMPDLSNDPCAKYANSCLTCAAQEGCYWCGKGKGTSFCTSADTPEKANCAQPGCSNDEFVVKLSQCSGGCSASTCDDCAKIPGCGWCWYSDMGPTGCQEAPRKGVPDSCSNFGMWGVGLETCAAPCEQRYSQDACLEKTRSCKWIKETESCENRMAGDPAVVEPPPKKEPEPAPAHQKVAPTTAERIAYDKEETIMARQGTVLVLLFAGLGVMVGVKFYRKRVF